MNKTSWEIAQEIRAEKGGDLSPLHVHDVLKSVGLEPTRELILLIEDNKGMINALIERGCKL